MGGIKLGKILGIEINIDWSWLLIFSLIVYTLAMGYFPTVHPGFGVAANWILGIIAALLLFTSVLIHELSHSVVARSYGTEVKGITLFLFGGVSQTADEPKSAKEEFWMAIVGPLASFVIAGIFYVLGGAGVLLGWPRYVIAVSDYLAFINLLLGIFNLMPGFPLDGGRVLRSIITWITGDMVKATQYASATGQAFGYLFMGVGFLRIVYGDLIGGLWLVFIGWFLAGAARSSYQQLLMRQALSGVRVDQVMTTDVPVIPSDLSVRQFVDEDLLRHEFACYPVVQSQDQNVIGVIGAEEVRSVPSDMWDLTRVGDIVHSIDNTYKVNSNDDVWDAVTKLSSQDVCRLVVIDDNHIVGTIGRESIFRLVQTKLQLSGIKR